MDDDKIVELFWQRSERALKECSRKFGNYCLSIAGRILSDREAAEECLNDTWLRAWNAMPPNRPRVLSVFLGKITRRLSLTRLERQRAKKRGGAYEAALEELSECVASAESAEQSYDENTLAELLRGFLAEQSEENRRVFLMRYWYFVPLRTIGTQCSLSESAVKARLFRMRAQLRELLTKEGYFV